MATTTTDVVIIGSGMGGATAALGLAPTGANITILERGSQIAPSAHNRDARAVYQRNHFKSDGLWYLPTYRHTKKVAPFRGLAAHTKRTAPFIPCREKCR